MSCTSSGTRSTSTNIPAPGAALNYIEHPVSKMDTLAGVAIKYGVEVADIKRMNGLATDLQMYALKSLQIPLPGRHPPSPSLSNGSASPGEGSTEKTPLRLGRSSVLVSFQSPQKVSPAMSTLQNFYGLKSPNQKSSAEGTEMAIFRTGKSDYYDDGVLPNASLISDPLSDCHQKSRFLGNGLLPENGAVVKDVPITETKDVEGEKSNEKFVRRRQKAEAYSGSGTPERLLREENGGGSSSFSAITAKCLALRPKSASRSNLVTDVESGWLNSTPLGSGDSIMDDGLAGVCKSSSASSLQDQDHNNTLWPTSKWSLEYDLQALSTVSIARPIFDGLPKPITGRRNKAALD